jgi:hypothetical protein
MSVIARGLWSCIALGGIIFAAVPAAFADEIIQLRVTGKPASPRALNNHCDNGPASNPIRLK